MCKIHRTNPKRMSTAFYALTVLAEPMATMDLFWAGPVHHGNASMGLVLVFKIGRKYGTGLTGLGSGLFADQF